MSRKKASQNFQVVAPVVENTARPTANPATEPILLDIKGAAAALSSTVWAVRCLLWSKTIPYIRIGKKFLLDPNDLRAFIQKQKTA